MSKLLDNIKPIIKSQHEGKIFYKQNPMDYLIKNDLLVQVGNGLFVLKGVLVELYNKIEQLIVKIANRVNAKEVIVPCILSWENANKSNYLNSFENQALPIVSLEEVKNNDNKVPNYHGLACPTVCYHYFSSLKDGSINENYAITAFARCTRREKGELNDLSRLMNFSMREIVFFGTQEFCYEQLNIVLNETKRILNDVFDLNYKIMTANDPFFGENDLLKKKAQLLSESKYELQAFLPFCNDSISVGSFNKHGSVFYDRFNISSKEPELKFSGCVGWGYERLIFSIVSQKGIDFDSEYYKKILEN
ncbi:MAG: aminoacyl--tRNA ligase-related protein [Promethearchaeota archaeon]